MISSVFLSIKLLKIHQQKLYIQLAESPITARAEPDISIGAVSIAMVPTRLMAPYIQKPIEKPSIDMVSCK